MGTVLNGSDIFRRYIDWACCIEWSDIPALTRHQTVLILANNIAAACSATNEPEVEKFRALLIAQGPSGAASLLSSGGTRLGVPAAAMFNGLAMGWNELDEGYRKAVCHAGLYVLPAMLAVAEAENFSTQEVLRATVLAYDTVARIARTWRFPTLDLHPHAVLAPVGAAAGVAYLRRLPPDQVMSAVSSATTLGMTGAFNQATQGVLVRNAWAGQGALAGLNAVMLASCGIGGSNTTPNDVYSALGASVDLSQLDPTMTPGFAVNDGYHKMNACCQYAHSAIEAVQTLLSEQPQLQNPDLIDKILVETHPLGLGLSDSKPTTTLGAKFSVPHAVAATFVYGHGGVEAFNTAALNNEKVATLRQRTTLLPFPELRPWPQDRPTRVRVISQGKEHIALCWSAQGGSDRPYTESMLWNKIETLSATVAPGLVVAMHRLDALAISDDNTMALSKPWREHMNDFLHVG